MRETFNPETARNYAEAVAYQRAVGTRGEQDARTQLAEQLKSIGLRVEHQPVHFSTALGVFLSLEILLSQLLIIAALGLSMLNQALGLIPAVLLGLLIASTGPLNRSVQRNAFAPRQGETPSWWGRQCYSLGTRYTSANLLASFPKSSSNRHLPHLVLVAHSDSKSQRIPLVVRIALFVVSIGGSLLFAALTLLGFLSPWFTNISLVVAVIVLLSSIPLLFLDFGNASPGAIDNASGIGLVLHLAEVLAQDSRVHKRLKISVLISAAEELATMGALAYVQENKVSLHEQAKTGLHIFNFDGPGVDGNLYLVDPRKGSAADAGSDLPDLIRGACTKLGIKLRGFGLPGALFDHMPFSDAGFDAASLIAIGAHTRHIHSANDSADKLDTRGFDQAGQVAMEVISRMAKTGAPSTNGTARSMNKQDLYRQDPLLRLLLDRLQFDPRRITLIAIGIAVLDLVFAWGYGLLTTRQGIVGALNDPPYLLTMFIMIPLFLRTYVWLPEGIWGICHGLIENRLVLADDQERYKRNFMEMVGRFNTRWVLIAALSAILIQVAILIGNLQYTPTYNTILTARLFLFRLPLGVIALYGAASVLIRVALFGDWSRLTNRIQPQINPLHWDQASGYGAFTQYIINLLGIFVGIATFFFTKLLFQPAPGRVAFQPMYDFGILLSLAFYLVAGFVFFYYLPTGAARRAITSAKRWQLDVIASRYLAENQVLLNLIRGESDNILALPELDADIETAETPEWEPPTIKGQIERLKQLNEAQSLVQSAKSSPINQKALRRFGFSYISIPLSTVGYNLFTFTISKGSLDAFWRLLAEGSLFEIIQGITRMLLTGNL